VPAVVTAMPVVDPSQGLHLFSLRGSTDATVVGITGAVYLIRFLRSGSLRDLAVLVASVLVVVSTSARAALLGTAAALALAVWLHHCGTPAGAAGRRRRLLVAGLLPLLMVGTGILLPRTAAGEKLLVGFGLKSASTRADTSAINTARGRSEAWRLVGAYVEEKDSVLLGVGFGPDFLADSGGLAQLGNGELLRSPHNYLVGTWARLGVVGVLLLALLLAAAVRQMFAMRTFAAHDVLGSFVVLFPVGFFISAVFGVELETPFGAIPFFWCLGVLLARPRAGAP
jgi:O-antigen ligase